MGETIHFGPSEAQPYEAEADLSFDLRHHISMCQEEIAMLERDGPSSSFDPVIVEGHIDLSKQELAELQGLDPATVTDNTIYDITQSYTNRRNALFQRDAA
jgi:hypothetical protein